MISSDVASRCLSRSVVNRPFIASVLFVCMLSFLPGASGRQVYQWVDKSKIPVLPLPPVDWPGAGNIKDWYAACELNRQANEAMDAALVMGTMTYDEAKLSGAVGLYEQAIARYPFETAFYDGLASCCLALKDDQTAEVLYRQSIKVKEKYHGTGRNVRYPDTYVALAELCARHHQAHDADLLYRKALALIPSARLWNEYASFLKEENRIEDSAAALRAATALDQKYNTNFAVSARTTCH